MKLATGFDSKSYTFLHPNEIYFSEYMNGILYLAKERENVPFIQTCNIVGNVHHAQLDTRQSRNFLLFSILVEALRRPMRRHLSIPNLLPRYFRPI